MSEVREVEVDALECDSDGNVRLVRLALTDSEGLTSIHVVPIETVRACRVER